MLCLQVNKKSNEDYNRASFYSLTSNGQIATKTVLLIAGEWERDKSNVELQFCIHYILCLIMI